MPRTASATALSPLLNSLNSSPTRTDSVLQGFDMSDRFTKPYDHVVDNGDDAEDDDLDDAFDDDDEMVGAGVTRAMIDNALARCRGTQDEDELDDDMMAAEEPFVVARGITAQDLLLVPDEWLGYNRLALLPDGTLIIDRLDSEEHRRAVWSASNACYAYATANQQRTLSARSNWVANLGELLGTRIPDVVVQELVDDDQGEWVPRVIVECVFEESISDRYIGIATEYLRNEKDVVRVIVFKFCTRRRRVDSPPHDLWEVPALAIVFGLLDPADRTSAVQIFETQSFGFPGVPLHMIDRLREPVNPTSRLPLLEDDGPALLPPGFQRVDLRLSLVDELRVIRCQGATLIFNVAVPVLGAMTFDLLAVFHDAMRGRARDEAFRQAGRNPRQVRRAARRNPQGPRQARQAAQQAALQAAPVPGGQSPLPTLDLENVGDDEMEVLDQAAAHGQ